MKFIRHSNRAGIGLVTAAFIAISTLGYGGVAGAQEVTDRETLKQAVEEKRAAAQHRLDEAKAKAEARAQEAKVRAQEAKEHTQTRASEAKQRLEGAKLEACQAREQRIEATMAQMTKRGENHIAVFTKITDRVKEFYENKGRVAENYDILVTEVDTKKLAAEAAVASTQSVGDVFSCDSDNPKIASQEFREAHKAQVAALKDYRTSVKNLIVAVKSAQAQTSTTPSTDGTSGEASNE